MISPYAVLSDVNGNLEALTAVLADIKKQGIENILFLGDAVGYGPNPAECMDILRENVNFYLYGRIESYIINAKKDNFNFPFQMMIDWTSKIIHTSLNRWEWLCSLKHMYKENKIMATHGDYCKTEHGCLLLQNVDAKRETIISEMFPYFPRILFIGDNHQAWILTEKDGVKSSSEIGNQFELNQQKAIVSVGSVGQPRDKNPRACYVIMRENKIVWRRVEYNIKTILAKIKSHPKLNNLYGMRLLDGI